MVKNKLNYYRFIIIKIIFYIIMSWLVSNILKEHFPVLFRKLRA